MVLNTVVPVLQWNLQLWKNKENFMFLILFYFKLFIYFLLYNIVLVLPYFNMNPPQVYMCPPSWTSLPPPFHPIPQGHPSAPALSTLSDASNLDWRSISHMIIYMIQCYSLKSSYPHLLPEKNPKVYSLHLCLFCCPAYRVIVTIFLNSIYMH